MKQEFGGRALVQELLKEFGNALAPGKGKEQAQLIRKTCKHYGWNENDFLPRFIVRDKKGWGLE